VPILKTPQITLTLRLAYAGLGLGLGLTLMASSLAVTGESAQTGAWRCPQFAPPLCWSSLNAVSVVGSSDVWAVGPGGLIAHFDGNGWSAVPGPTSAQLYDIDMVSAGDGWAVGGRVNHDTRAVSGVILRLEAGTWREQQHPGSAARIMAVDAMSPDEAWAVNETGEVLRHAGGTWRIAGRVPGVFLNSISMVNNTMGWATGNDGSQALMVRYQNDTWVKVPVGGGLSDAVDVKMLAANDGWALGLRFNADATFDSVLLRFTGSTWSQADFSRNAVVSRLDMADSSSGWAVGRDGLVLGIAGGHFQRQTSPTSLNLYDVATRQGQAWAVGAGGAVLSNSGGAGWSRQGRAPTDATLRAVSVINRDYAWSGGDGGTILRGGETGWVTEGVAVTDTVIALDMSHVNEGWAIGQAVVPPDSLLHYRDGTWRVRSSPITDTLSALDMNGFNEGWAVGGGLTGGVALRFEDGIWTAAGTIAGEWLNAIDLFGLDDGGRSPPRAGWAGGESGVLVRHTGGNWIVTAGPTQATITAIDMVSEDDTWATAYEADLGGGGDSLVLRHRTGQWSLVWRLPNARLDDLYMLGPDEGWAVGVDMDGRAVLARYDSAWTRVSSPTNAPLLGVSFGADGTGWAVGNHGVLLQFPPPPPPATETPITPEPTETADPRVTPSATATLLGTPFVPTNTVTPGPSPTPRGPEQRIYLPLTQQRHRRALLAPGD
jgi:hypothetical protein